MDHILIIMFGALAGGFVSGLSGFGTGITAVGIWLHVLSPAVAASLVVICSIVSQLQSLPRVWRSFELTQVLPFVVFGIIGVPIGTVLLLVVDVRLFKLGIGCLLLLFSISAFWKRSGVSFKLGGKVGDGLVGLFGGILGGIAGLSGPGLAIWADIRGWTKNHRRAIFQSFNLCILFAAFISHYFAGFLTRELGMALLCALPGTILGAAIGTRLFFRLSDQRYREIILILLAVSGGILISSAW